MRINKLLLSFALAIAGSANAAKWPNEPKEFMGINIDGQELNIPTCQNYNSKEFCNFNGIIRGQPDIGFPYEILMIQHEGKVAFITLNMSHDDIDDMVDLLIKRYGKPTSISRSVVQNRMGAKFASKTAFWDGAKVQIVAEERTESLDKSSVTVYHKATSQALSAEYKKERSGNEKKL